MTSATTDNPPGDDDVRLTLLHTSDWHLGHPYTSFDDVDRMHLSQFRLATVKEILKLAHQHRVDAVLAAGDLFDGPHPSRKWWSALVQAFDDMTHRCPVVLLPGNHDPLRPDSVYGKGHQFRATLPDHVHLVDEGPWELSLRDDAVILAQPTTSNAGGEDAALALPDREEGDDRIRVGMAHGLAIDFGGRPPDFPIAPDAAAQRGLDYLALGDFHGYRKIADAESDGTGTTYYCGTPEPMRFGEEEGGAVQLVFLRRHGRPPRVRRVGVCQRHWKQVTCTSMGQLRDLLNEADLHRTVLRLTLDMAVSVEELEEVERALETLRGTEVQTGKVGLLESVDKTQLRLMEGAFDEELPPDVPHELRVVHEELRSRLDDAEQAPAAEQALLHLRRLVASRAYGRTI